MQSCTQCLGKSSQRGWHLRKGAGGTEVNAPALVGTAFRAEGMANAPEHMWQIWGERGKPVWQGRGVGVRDGSEVAGVCTELLWLNFTLR